MRALLPAVSIVAACGRSTSPPSCERAMAALSAATGLDDTTEIGLRIDMQLRTRCEMGTWPEGMAACFAGQTPSPCVARFDAYLDEISDDVKARVEASAPPPPMTTADCPKLAADLAAQVIDRAPWVTKATAIFADACRAGDWPARMAACEDPTACSAAFLDEVKPELVPLFEEMAATP